tara:strand:+ start:242 stop:991 length:750 start_codon:yes stop_codon:yes gene_type:complete
MIDHQIETIVILPHLDDEFALVPIIKKITSSSKEKLTIIYCAERNKSIALNNKRRGENIKALALVGCSKERVIYLNDYFEITDLKLIDASAKIYNFLYDFLEKNNVKQIVTLSFEGGHPDHDSLALIVSKISQRDGKLNSFFVPAYNNRKTLTIPISVFRPLKNQKKFFTKNIYSFFIWIDAVLIALSYPSERSAFIKLMPFILYKAFFSRSVYISSKIDIDSVNWEKSLSLKRYLVKKHDILNKIEGL